MKGIYTSVNGKVYKINQNTRPPLTDVLRVGSNSMSVKEDSTSRTTVADIYLTDFCPVKAKSNKENFNDLTAFLVDNKVKEIDNLEDNFFVSVDYTIRNAEDKEIEHSVIIKPVKVKDFIYPLGINEENECVYRRFKHLNMYIEWIVMNKLPYGIMCKKNPRTYIQINDITFWQDKQPNTDEHQSIYSQPYNRHMCTCTINSSLENKIPVFSTKCEGIVLQEIVNTFQPRVIGLNLDIDLTNFIVVYDTAVIDAILEENKREDDPHNPPVDPEDEPDGCNCNCHCNNNEQNNSNTEQTEEPNNSNTNQTTQTTISYEKVDSEREGSLVVVDDDIDDSSFDNNSMIKMSDIKEYIDDINIGDIVIKVEIPVSVTP